MVRLPHRADGGLDRARAALPARAASPADPRRRRRSRPRRTGSRGTAPRRCRRPAPAQADMARLPPGRRRPARARRRPRSGAQQVDHGRPQQQIDDREQPERRPLVREVVTASAVRSSAAHDPRLPPPLGDQPSRLQRDDPSGPSSANASSQRRPSGSRRRRSAATSDGDRGQRHRGSGADHHLKRGAHRQHRRPFVARETPPDRSRSRRGRRTPGATARTAPGSRRGTRPCRGPASRRCAAAPGLRVQVRLDRGQLDRLRDRQVLRRKIARQRLQQRRDARDRQRQRERLAVQRARRIAQQHETRGFPPSPTPSPGNRRCRTCTIWYAHDGLHIAATGSVPSGPPAGPFMNALTSVTNAADAAPLAATPMPDARCRRGDTRSRP